MEKLTLNKTWTECLRMGRWIAKEMKADGSLNVIDLKAQWLKKHNYTEMDCNCFFCEYDFSRSDDCRFCPGKKVDRKFHCRNNDYDFISEPVAFYNKLVALNRKRLKK